MDTIHKARNLCSWFPQYTSRTRQRRTRCNNTAKHEFLTSSVVLQDVSKQLLEAQFAQKNTNAEHSKQIDDEAQERLAKVAMALKVAKIDADEMQGQIRQLADAINADDDDDAISRLELLVREVQGEVRDLSVDCSLQSMAMASMS